MLAPQLTGKALKAHVAMANADAKDYMKVNKAIFRHYDINEETYKRFCSANIKRTEAPFEMLTQITDLADKWLVSCTTREEVIDCVILEQFVNVLPKEARTWVKERKPSSSKEAGRLAEDFRQATKDKWEAAIGRKVEEKRCQNCKVGHLAKDCRQWKDLDKSSKEDKNKPQITCYNCKARGHIAKNCPKAMFCRLREESLNQRLLYGRVEGRVMKDIQLDTGCSHTVVRSELVDKQKFQGDTVSIHFAHGDIVSYPVAVVEIDVGRKLLQVEAAVSDTLPRSVLLGTDVPELNSLHREKRGESGCAVVTRSGARRQKKEEEELQWKEKESGAKTTVEVDAEESDTVELTPAIENGRQLSKGPGDKGGQMKPSKTRRNRRMAGGEE
uniref:CCHC-type domain-containing protein n=1 Tax=Amphimedon queenslandica TaxID=400682 RepID=A0A1X7VUY5_AMPQE